ncbi:Neuropeptide-like peptide 36 [Caenorhabditis elegans]|uniref:Neuropeptide-like peptide 36 n=1 Tax=Caenorhabditis elegans TaxID=6239 RepID=H2KYZ3_CAEEL|nr:Neuropeptide-like peptide 36 [Caenorhabditis elegans]CCD65382.1 Neuropeptide-like peptide 36 [Caenorhabditis elegans]|eukprot:NP_509518.1 Uncharacterized protein CELE_C24A3.2 [Caenorhabditis elegans]
MVDLKQQLQWIDYLGVVAVWLCFFGAILVISITCILWCCVSKDDDPTVFAKYGFGPQPRIPSQRSKLEVDKDF